MSDEIDRNDFEEFMPLIDDNANVFIVTAEEHPKGSGPRVGYEDVKSMVRDFIVEHSYVGDQKEKPSEGKPFAVEDAKILANPDEEAVYVAMPEDIEPNDIYEMIRDYKDGIACSQSRGDFVKSRFAIEDAPTPVGP